jgi:hypothetical protein
MYLFIASGNLMPTTYDSVSFKVVNVDIGSLSYI